MQLQPRKSPSQRRSAMTIEAVLESAARILDDRGMEGFNTNAIAERAGISVGSLYQYFPSKEAVTAALIVRRHQQMAACLQSVLSDTIDADFDAAISRLLGDLIKLHAGSRQLDRTLEAEELRLPAVPGLRELRSEVLDSTRLMLARYVDVEMLGAARLEHATRDVVCIVAALLHVSLHSSAAQDDDLQDRLFRTVRAYLAPLLRERVSRAATP